MIDDYFFPTAAPTRGVLTISEERNLWVKGRLVADPEVCVEMSFETYKNGGKPLPGTHVTYLGAWRHSRCLIEYQLGVLCRVPDRVTYDTLIAPLVTSLSGHFPMRTSRDAIDALRDAQMARFGAR